MATSGNRGPAVFVVTVALFAVATVFVFLRMLSRIRVVRRVSYDDYFMVLAWMLGFGIAFSICYGTSVGLGRHEVDVRPEWESSLKKSEFAFSVLYNPALMATKTSILIFYLTLAKQQKNFRWLVITTLAVVNVAGLALTFLNIFQCRPFNAVFLADRPNDAKCTDIVTLYLSSAPVNIITDLAILFLPMPVLTGMNLPRKQKIILLVTFSFGFFSCCVDVVRIAYLQQAALGRLQKSSGNGSKIIASHDFSWYASLSFSWSSVEISVGIICACVPGLKPLVAKILPNMLKDSRDYSRGSQSAIMQLDQEMQESPRHRSPTVPESAFVSPGRASGSDGSHNGSDGLEFGDVLNMNTDITRVHTANTRRSRRSAVTSYFDFVSVHKPKSMLKMTNRESIRPITIVTILFFLWGFAYGLLDSLNGQFQKIANMDEWQTVALHAAYYAGYVAPLLFGRYFLQKFSFRICFIIGLCVYAVGAIMFWPSAVLTSLTAFIFSNVITGMGLSTLEIAANPFIALCGPPEYSETRLNISQGVQAVGTVVAPLLANKVLFKNYLDAPSLINSQWTYLGIALFDVILAVVFWYVPLPEAPDKELAELAAPNKEVNKTRVIGIPVVYLTLSLGVFSQFCYVSGQEAVNVYFGSYIKASANLRLPALDYQAIGHTLFAAGRFLTAFVALWIAPRHILLFQYLGVIVITAVAMNVRGEAAIAMAILIYLFESGIFPTIYAICLRGLGARTKLGATLITAAISGGAVTPVFVTWVSNSRGIRYAFCCVVATFAFGAVFPAYLCLVPAARKQVDPSEYHHNNHRRMSLPIALLTSAKQEHQGRLEKKQQRQRRSCSLPSHEHDEHIHSNDFAPWPV
ncbi:MAG: hypothetical protein M1834_009762 [Cirrosporium novae-zelandiae]|nr:MAG: hypothetical protein M1834_009762 [Cirrosporium novae-zelandiae]